MNTYYMLGSEASVANKVTAGTTLRKLTHRGVYLRGVIGKNLRWLPYSLPAHHFIPRLSSLGWGRTKKKEKEKEASYHSGI